jgi:hypothetical protein
VNSPTHAACRVHAALTGRSEVAVTITHQLVADTDTHLTAHCDLPNRRHARRSTTAQRSSTLPCTPDQEPFVRPAGHRATDGINTRESTPQRDREMIDSSMRAATTQWRAAEYRTLSRSDRASHPASFTSHRATSREPLAHATKRAVEPSCGAAHNQTRAISINNRAAMRR